MKKFIFGVIVLMGIVSAFAYINIIKLKKLQKYLVVWRKMCTFAPVQWNERLARASHFHYYYKQIDDK